MNIIFFITLFLYSFIVGSFSDYVDYDYFARLIVGKTFFQTGDVLKYDFLSYGPTHAWYDHEWGASVLFYFIQDHFGDLGLLLLKTITLFFAFFFIVLIIKLRRKTLFSGKQFPILNFLFFYVVCNCLMNHIYSLRCHHFTFVLFTMWLYVLEKARLEKNYRILWTLPLLMIVWSNIHGGCFMAIGITGIYLIGEFLAKRAFMPYFYTILASFLLMFINPYGVDYVLFLLKATTMNRPNIMEWLSPFHRVFLTKLILYKLTLIFLVGSSVYNFIKEYKKSLLNSKIEKIKEVIQKLDYTKCLLIFILMLLTIKSVRFIPYFMFILSAFCYDDFYEICNKRLPEKINKAKEILIFVFVLIVFGLNVLVEDFKMNNYHTIFPLSEIEFLKLNNVKGNLLVPFEIGSYAAYKLYPNNYIFMDGRYEEVYPPNSNDVYLKSLNIGLDDWEKGINLYHHDLIIIYKDSKIFYENMKKNPDFFDVIESRAFALFIRKDVYRKLKKPLKIPSNNPKFYKYSLWQTQINWEK